MEEDVSKPLELSHAGPIKPLLKSWSEAIGRTIKSVTEEDVDDAIWPAQFLVFRFDDGSGLVIQHYGDGDGDGGGGYSGDPETLDDNARARAYFGIDSMEEYARAQEELAAKYKAKDNSNERAAYERLKRKFSVA